MADQRTLEVVIKAEDQASKIMQGVGSTLDDLSGRFKSVGSSISSVGKSLTTSLTLPLTAIGAVAVIAGNQVDEAMDQIIAGTGITGDEIKKMEVTFKNVASSATQGMGDVADVMTSLSQRMGVFGDDLETSSRKVLTFARVNRVDASSAVESLARMLKATGGDVSDLNQYLDQLTLAAQKSGANAGNLASMVADSAPAFKTLGFGVTDTIALLAQLEKSGARPEEVMASMGRALSNLSSKGFKTAEEGLNDYLKRIKEAPSDLEAVGISAELFGARAGYKLAAQIRAGTFEIENLSKALKDSDGVLDQASDSTMSFDERMAQLKNQVTLALQPLGQAMFDLFESMRPTIEKLVQSLTSLTTWFANLDPGIRNSIIAFGAFLAVIGPILMIVGTLVTSIGSIITAVGALAGVFSAVVPAIGAVVAVLGGPLTIIIGAIIGLIALLTLAWTQNWFGIQEKVQVFIDWFSTYVLPLLQSAFAVLMQVVQIFVDLWVIQFQLITAVTQGLVDWFMAYVVPLLTSAFELLKSIMMIWVNLWVLQINFLKSVITPFVNWFMGTIVPLFKNAFDVLVSIGENWVNKWVDKFNFVKGVIEGVIGTFQSLINKAREAADVAAGKLNVKSFQEGGFVPQTGLALLHRGEFVASNDMLEGRKSVPSSVENVFNQPINIQANVDNSADMNLLGDRIAFALRNSR
jgi:TP901 family phage tail tape measure protein